MYILNKQQEQLLNKIYYEDKFLFGRDKLFDLLKTKYPEYNISRRMLMYWLKNQEVYQVNARAPRTKSSKAFNVKKAGYVQIDLIDMSSNPERGFFWILTAVDIYSKKAFAIPLKTKKKTSVVRGLYALLDFYDVVSVIQSDNGSEFDIPEFFEKNKIKHIYSKPYTPQSQGFVEKFNGTLKTLIEKNRQITNKNMWIDDLPTLVDNYNNVKHDVSKTVPNDSTDYTPEIKKSPLVKSLEFIESILDVGSKVRVKLKKSALQKKLSNNYTKEIYTVHRIIRPKNNFDVIQYKLKDSDNDLIEGLYNASELILAEFPNNVKIK